ncbi:MAG TPA: hypothetical protein VN693_06215 [Rhodanobacteraceae bacterium]|nr:hypothetical protein [Rhodanobacteraceae bacterium]
MNIRSCAASTVLIFLLCMLSGCAGKSAFLSVQICLGNEQNVALFKDTMRSISQAHNIGFVDNSAASQEESIDLKIKQEYPMVMTGAVRKDGVGWLASNSGLSRYEVLLGFFDGSNPAEAHRFADLVVRELKKKWPVYVVPTGRGALPMKDCRGRSVAPAAPSSAPT